MEHNELVVQSSKGCHEPMGVLWGLSEERRPKHPAVVGTSRITQGLDPDTLLQGKDPFADVFSEQVARIAQMLQSNL